MFGIGRSKELRLHDPPGQNSANRTQAALAVDQRQDPHRKRWLAVAERSSQVTFPNGRRLVIRCANVLVPASASGVLKGRLAGRTAPKIQ
jgi:hypothetical protein